MNMSFVSSSWIDICRYVFQDLHAIFNERSKDLTRVLALICLDHCIKNIERIGLHTDS